MEADLRCEIEDDMGDIWRRRRVRSLPRRIGLQELDLSVEDTTAEDEKYDVVGALAQLVDRENLTEDTLVNGGTI